MGKQLCSVHGSLKLEPLNEGNNMIVMWKEILSMDVVCAAGTCSTLV